MNWDTWGPIISAASGAGAGGLALRYLSHFLDKRKVRFDQDAVRRSELATENAELRKEQDATEERYEKLLADYKTEAERWQRQYYELRDEHHETRFQLMQQIQELNLKLQIAQLKIKDETE